MAYTYSENGLNLTKSFESCRLMPYKDGGGVWTDGWGNTKNVVPGKAISQAKADADLAAHVAVFTAAMNKLIKVHVTQNQFDACVDLMFNIGVTAFSNSTLLKKLNAGDFEGAANEFPRWNKDNGVEVKGLTRRRLAEKALFLRT